MSRFATSGSSLSSSRGSPSYVFETEPRWYERLRYPLRYEEIVVGHAENYHLDPQLVARSSTRSRSSTPDAVSASGAVGLMQFLRDGPGNRRPHRRELVEAR